VGITIPAARLRSVLERAVEVAESDTSLPEEWLSRTERIGQSPSRAYVAALGTALLAKTADNRIDALAVKSSAGPNAYSMRGVVKVLVERADLYGYHLGVTRGEPLNAQPFFRVKRIDEPAPIKKNARPFFRDLTRYLIEADGLDEDDALLALAAFLRVRIAYATVQRETRVRLVAGPSELSQLVAILEHFLEDDPEEGRRGQALAAAVLDLLHDDVELAAINDPTPLDVRVVRDDEILLGVEVKQKPIAEHDGLDLAEGVARAGSDKALLLALAANQPVLSAERIRRAAADSHGVLIVTYQGVMEFVSHAAAHSRLTASEFAARLPDAFLQRMQEQQVSVEGQQHWADLVAALSES
jgi:hypothetical protein